MFLPSNVEDQLFQFVGDHHHVPAERVNQFAGGVSVDLHVLGGGAVFTNPADGVALLHAGQFDDGAVLAEGVADAFIAVFVVHVHAAGVGGNADVIGDENQHGVRVGIFAYCSMAASFSSFDPRP